MSLFWDIGLIIVFATFLAYVARILRQPLILAYMAAGVIIGPFGLGLIREREVITILSEFGIAFLLFIVGLELDLRRLRDIGLVSTTTALVSTAILFFLGFNAALALGFVKIEAAYLGLMIAFSSTMVVIKLLSDKNELDTLHGRIILGILLTQDVVAILALSIISTPGQVSFNEGLMALFKGAGLFSVAIILSKYILPPVFKFVAKSQELLFLTALSLCFVFSYFSYLAGFSVAIGAFIAGVSVATFPYNIEIISRIHSLRDFFATLFFVSLGMELWFESITPLVYPLLVFSFLLIIIKPLIMMMNISFFGYGSRSSFLTSISLAQISEFSLIIALTGVSVGHISHVVFSLAALMALVSLTLTSYLIKFENAMYSALNRFLLLFERLSRNKSRKLEDIPKKTSDHIIVVGGHRMGYNIVKTLTQLKEQFLVVDYNPEVIKALMGEGVHCIYGDIGDMEILNRINLSGADMIISTIPDDEDSMLLIEETKKVNPRAVVFVTANTLDEALNLYDLGADYVILPRMLSGRKVSELIHGHARRKRAVEHLKREHIHELEFIKEEELLDRYEPSFLKSLERKFNGHHKRRSLRNI